jgi:biopolymer transport protein ExbB/TolQ
MRLRKQLEDTIGTLFQSRNRGVFNTGYTLDQIEQELDRRDKVLRKVEQRFEKHSKEKKQYLQKAADSKHQTKLRYAAKAKEADMYKRFFSSLFDNLMAQQLFLTNLSLKAKQSQLFDNPMEEFGFEIDISGMNADAVSRALEDTGFEQEEVEHTMEEIGMSMEMMDEDGITLSLDEIKDDIDNLQEDELMEGGGTLAEGFDEKIDEQIEDELQQLSDGASLSSGSGEGGSSSPSGGDD